MIKKFKSTKFALLLSALSLLICVTMLIGSTFAWFTDTVTSTGNIIKSGKLDVEMYWADGTKDPANVVWTDASEGAIFDYSLWEPGYTEVRHIKIANEGTLALKYQLNIIANGKVSKLADVIDVYYVDPAVKIADRSALTDANKLGTLTQVLENINTTASGNLKAGEKDTITLALKMQENAGNAYQDLAIGSDFSIQLLATQLTSEFDSFDNQYDVKATYLNQDADGAWLINNIDELYYFAFDVNSGNTYNGETVKLTANIDLAGYNWIPIGKPGNGGTTDFSTSFRGTFDGQGHTVSNIKVNNEGWAGLFGLAYRSSIKNVTVKDATINSSRMSGAVVGQIYGCLENCHIINANITLVPNAVNGGYDNGDKVGGIVGWLGDNGNNHYIKGCSATNVTIKGYRDIGGIAGYIGTTTTVENCAVDTVTITVDQATNHYEIKDANAGGVVGRIYKQPVTLQNNTQTNVKLNVPTFVSNAAGLQTAIDNSNSGDTIALVNDVTVSDALTMNKSFTLDLNGKTLYMSTTDDSKISSAANVIIKNGNVDISGVNFTEHNGIFNITGGAANTLTVENVNFYGDGFTSYSVFWIAKASSGINTLNLIDSKFELKNEAYASGGFIKHPSSGENCSAINITNSVLDFENVTRLFLYGAYNIKDSEISFVDTTGEANGLRQGQFTIDNSKITISGGDKGISPRYADTVIKNGSVVTINNTKGNDVIFEYDFDVVVDSSSTFTYGTTSGTAGGQVIDN